MTVSLSIMIEKSTRWTQVELFFPTRLVRHTSEDQRKITQINNRNLPGRVLQPTTALNAPQLHVMLRCFKLQRRPFSVSWMKMAGRSWIAAIHKKSFIVFFVFSLFFFNDGNWSPVFVQQKNSFKWLKTQKTQTYQIKSKTILESIVLPFCLMPPPPHPPPVVLGLVWTRYSWHKGVSVQSKSAFWVSVQLFLSGWRSAPGPWSDSGPVRCGAVGVRCGWVGARGWTAGCSPPSPWWSSEEQTACWGTTGRQRNRNFNMFDFGPSTSWMLN